MTSAVAANNFISRHTIRLVRTDADSVSGDRLEERRPTRTTIKLARGAVRELNRYEQESKRDGVKRLHQCGTTGTPLTKTAAVRRLRMRIHRQLTKEDHSKVKSTRAQSRAQTVRCMRGGTGFASAVRGPA